MATVDVKLDDKTELTLPANANDYIYILRQVAGGGFQITDYKIKVRNLIGDALPFTDDLSVPTPSAGTVYFNSTDSQMRGYDGVSWHNMYNNVLNTKTTLTASEIKNIGTTPVTVVPAQGVGTIISLVRAIAVLNYVSAPFDNNPLKLKTNTGGDFWEKINFLNKTEYRNEAFTFAGQNQQNYVENQPLILTGTDSIATGDSTIDVYVSYQVITL